MDRRLTTILAADVVGYSRLMGMDEEGTLAALKTHRSELIEPKSAQYHGRTIKLMGDGALMEFASVIDAVHFAVEVQCEMRERNLAVPEEKQLVYRIGINIGDTIVDGEDIYGDGVNVASRLEGQSEPGGICIAANVFDQVKGKLDLTYENLGEVEFKNIAEPLLAYRIMLDDKAASLVTPVVPPEPVSKSQSPRASLAIAATLLLIAVGAGGAIWWKPWVGTLEKASMANMALPLPEKPSIAVLAFKGFGQDQEQGFLAEALSENIITELSRFPEFFVIARNSSFSYKGQEVNVKKVAEELGVRYVLEGSLQKAGDRLRVNAQLIDAIEGSHVWAERYDREASDLFAIQDDITGTIVATVHGKVRHIQRTNAHTEPRANLSALGYIWEGDKYWLEWTKDSIPKAIELYEKARDTEPSFSRAYSALASAYIPGHRYGWFEPEMSRDAALNRAREMADKALELAPYDYYAHFMLGNVYSEGGQNDLAMAEYRRALELNPNATDVMFKVATKTAVLGKFEDALEQFDRAMRLNPHHPDWWHWNVGWTMYLMEDYEPALARLQMMQPFPDLARRTLAAIYVGLGQMKNARAEVEKLLEKYPDYTLEEIRLMMEGWDPVYLNKWVDDLRKAGLPEKESP